MNHAVLPTLLALLTLAGCVTSPNPAIPTIGKTTVPSATETVSVSATPTREPQITPTSIPANPTTLSTATNSPAPQIGIQCLPILPALPEEARSDGVIVLEGYNYQPSYLFNLSTKQRTSLPLASGDDLDAPAVSPDGKYLAYLYREGGSLVDPARLIITTADGRQIKTLLLDEAWRTIVDWHDGEHIWISKKGTEPYDLDTLVLFNPFTEAQEEFRPDYPEIKLLDRGPDWEGFTFTRFVMDPTLSRVVYPMSSAEGVAVVLWDRDNNRPLAKLPGSTMDSQTPKWSPTGTYFIQDRSPHTDQRGDQQLEEVYRISRDGEIERLTFLTEDYEDVKIGQYNLSPDGRYLAFWLTLGPEPYPEVYTGMPNQPTPRLTLLDLETKQVTNYCVPGDLFTGVPWAPIWSPDSRQVAVSSLTDRQHNKAVIVDFAQGYAAQIGEDLTPQGWMKTP